MKEFFKEVITIMPVIVFFLILLGITLSMSNMSLIWLLVPLFGAIAVLLFLYVAMKLIEFGFWLQDKIKW